MTTYFTIWFCISLVWFLIAISISLIWRSSVLKWALFKAFFSVASSTMGSRSRTLDAATLPQYGDFLMILVRRLSAYQEYRNTEIKCQFMQIKYNSIMLKLCDRVFPIGSETPKIIGSALFHIGQYHLSHVHKFWYWCLQRAIIVLLLFCEEVGLVSLKCGAEMWRFSELCTSRLWNNKMHSLIPESKLVSEKK